jgi:signal transduction histidine kinase
VLAHEEVDEFSSLAADRQVDLDVDLDHTTSAPVDPAMVRRAVDNLLANAVRLAPPGSTVRTSVGTSPDGQWAFVAVRDDGPGIPVPHQRRVFDRFWRVDPPGAEPDGHTGLGLSIVRQVAEAHGGLVRLHSSVGLGSVFVIWLPVTRGRGGGPPERSSSGPPELSPVELVGQFMDGSSG